MSQFRVCLLVAILQSHGERPDLATGFRPGRKTPIVGVLLGFNRWTRSKSHRRSVHTSCLAPSRKSTVRHRF